MSSLRTRLLAGTIAGTTIAFAIGGFVAHRVARIRLGGDTDAALAQELEFAKLRLQREFGARHETRGRAVRPGDVILARPTVRSDTLYVCRTVEGVLVDASDELGEATAVIDLPNASATEPVFGDFVLVDGAPARGAALEFRPDLDSRGGFPPWGGRDEGFRGRGNGRRGEPWWDDFDARERLDRPRRGDGRPRDSEGAAPAPQGPPPGAVPVPRVGEEPSRGDEPDAGEGQGTAGDGSSTPGAAPGAFLQDSPSPANDPEPPEAPQQEDGYRYRLIVLQSVAAREAFLRQLALILGATWFGTCLVGTGALWLTIRRGLRPLEDLRLRIADLDWRSSGQPVVVAGAPEELAPVIAQLEESRQRIVGAFRRERRFVGDAAHELRTPVSGIKSILEVALRRERSNEDLKGYARECLAIADEMGRAVEALLTLGKLSRGEVALELTDVDLRVLAEEAWKPLAFDARARGITLEVLGDPAPIVANRDLLLRALANLVDNAVEYGVDGGVVRVEHVRTEGASVIEVSNTVRDVPEGLEEHAFEPFWRGDLARTDAARHAGLGLALVNQIAELHDGRAEIGAVGDRVIARVTIPDA